MTRHEPVVTTLNVQLMSDNRTVPVPAVLVYDPNDPFAVHVRFQISEDRTVEWVFSRELLTDGLRRPVGIGDVALAPAVDHGREVVLLSLVSPSGAARMQLPRGKVYSFLRRAAAAVAPGSESEHVDWDAELALLTS